MISFILDNSMTMAWCFPEEATPATETVLHSLSSDHVLFVPVLWPYEVGNTLSRAVRKGRITSLKAAGFLEDLNAFEIVVDNGTSRAFHKVYAYAEKYGLTTYDAAYLELSIRKGLPIASLDNELNRAAVSEGVALFQGQVR